MRESTQLRRFRLCDRSAEGGEVRCDEGAVVGETSEMKNHIKSFLFSFIRI